MSPLTGLARLLGRILRCAQMGNFNPVDQMNSRNTTKMVEQTCIACDCHSFVDSCNFINNTPEVEIHTRPKLCQFGRYVVRAKLFCLKCFILVTRLECSYGKFFILVTKILVTAIPASHMNTDILPKTRVARRDLRNLASPVDRAHTKRP